MSWYLERRRSEQRLERRTAAPPILKIQFERSIDRSLPKYQFRVMFSVLTTSAYEFGWTCMYITIKKSGLLTNIYKYKNIKTQCVCKSLDIVCDCVRMYIVLRIFFFK